MQFGMRDLLNTVGMGNDEVPTGDCDPANVSCVDTDKCDPYPTDPTRDPTDNCMATLETSEHRLDSKALQNALDLRLNRSGADWVLPPDS